MKPILVKLLALMGAMSFASQTLAVDYPLTVNNIHELRSMAVNTLSATNAVFVQGYRSPGDRGGGFFQWVSGASNPDDGGRYLTNYANSSGRWVRSLNGETANVKMWGATGDGNNFDDTIS